MVNTEYIPQANADKILNLLLKAKEVCGKDLGFWLCSDDCETSVKTRKPEKVITEMDGVDDNFGINLIRISDKECLGWFYITPYEDEDCVICNYSDNELCRKLKSSVDD